MIWLCEASQHDADHGETAERLDGADVTLVVAGEAAVAADPRESALDDPAFGQSDKGMRGDTPDDLDDPAALLGDSGGELGAAVSSIGIDTLDAREGTAQFAIEEKARARVVVDVGRMDDDTQQQAERVDNDMALAAGEFLAGVIALRIKPGAPF